MSLNRCLQHHAQGCSGRRGSSQTASTRSTAADEARSFGQGQHSEGQEHHGDQQQHHSDRALHTAGSRPRLGTVRGAELTPVHPSYASDHWFSETLRPRRTAPGRTRCVRGPRSAPVPGISGWWSHSNRRAGTSAARGASTPLAAAGTSAARGGVAVRGVLRRTAADVDSAVGSPGAQSRKASAGQLMMMLADPSGSPPGAVTTLRAANSNTFSASVFSPLRPAATAASL